MCCMLLVPDVSRLKTEETIVRASLRDKGQGDEETARRDQEVLYNDLYS